MKRLLIIATFMLGTAACATSSQGPSPQASSEDVKEVEEGKEADTDAKKAVKKKKTLVTDGSKGQGHKVEPQSKSGVPLASSPQGMMTVDGAERIRRALIDRGYLNAVEEGTYDDATTRALEKFQEDNELARTGAPDRETLKKLGLDPKDVLKRNEGTDESEG